MERQSTDGENMTDIAIPDEEAEWYDERELLSVRNYKIGYQVRTENIVYDGTPPSAFKTKSAYTANGDYIGTPIWAHRLMVRDGITPEIAHPDHSVCSIGFCEKDQKWYGWSHRAIYGFGVGAVAKEGDCITSSGWTDEYLQAHPEADISIPVGSVAHNLDDARRFALAFAESVS